MQINIKNDESVTIIGRKGTGKTLLMKHIIKIAPPQGISRTVILDTKQVGDFAEYPAVSKLSDLPKIVGKHPITVYAPNNREAKDEDYINGFFGWCYDRWNTRVVIDELTSIMQGNDTPDSYRDITDRGRAKHVTLLQGNQKPVFVPHAALSEADHFFMFDLQIESARKKMAGIMNEKVMVRPRDPHGFWYYHHSMLNPIYVPGIDL